MNISDEKTSLLALWLIPGLGPKKIQELVDYFGTAQNVLQSNRASLYKVNGISDKLIRLIEAAKNSEELQKELSLLRNHNINLVSQSEDAYPKLLKEIYNAPPLLYSKGNIDLKNQIPIGFVGSRKASFQGKSICRKLIKELSEINPSITIVSGLALGIDAAAHSAALEFGLKTVAVLAGGLSEIYPPQNRNLAHEITEKGALVTEFPFLSKPKAGNFPLRNRIISGISKGVVIVEAGERSGALITAGYTLEQNRELFALPGPADSNYFRGTNRLIQKGQAKLILEAQDILEEIITDYKRPTLDEQITSPSKSHQQRNNTNQNHQDNITTLTIDEISILNLLKEGAIQQDSLAERLSISLPRLLATLTSLEMKNLVVSKPGSIYESVNIDS